MYTLCLFVPHYDRSPHELVAEQQKILPNVHEETSNIINKNKFGD
jgi:hypothetical protein